jgi:putative ABC transport system permease protein
MAALHLRLLWAEWRHHPWRQGAAVLAVALGVALAFAVQLINASALSEFSAAVHAASGAPDFSVRPRDGMLAEDLYPRLAMAPGVAQASPVIDLSVSLHGADGQAHPAHLLGLDAFVSPWISPGWLVQPESASGTASPGTPLSALDPDVVYLNAAARTLVGRADRVALQVDGKPHAFAIGGRIAADGPPLLVMDIAGAQTHFERVGSLSRIDVRLAPGARQDAVMAALDAGPDDRAAAPDEAALRMAKLSQSYRVNLSVLSLVALFTGGFLVFSVQSLAVAKRIPQFALLGVLGMDGRQRRTLVWTDSLMVGVLGGVAGLALGTALAAAALRALGGDLGSGTLGGSAPRLQWSALAALAYGALGVASAFAGGWWPARAAQGIAPAQSLKGLSSAAGGNWPAWAGLALIALAGLLALVPPWHAIPWGAYACVGVLLLGGISLVPQVVALLLEGFRGARNPVAALAVARAVDQRHTATAAVAGVVASLSLVVALTVMVTSFRDSLIAWLDDVLPADLYIRQVPGASDTPLFLPPAVVAAASGPGVRQVRAERLVPVTLAPDQPEVSLLVRDLLPGETQPHLPWVVAPDDALPASPDLLSVWPTEVLAALQHLNKGDVITVPLPPPRDANGATSARTTSVRAVVRGIWRDYARQQGALLMSRTDWLRLTGDDRISGLAVWLDDAGPQGDAAGAIRAGSGTSTGTTSTSDARPGKVPLAGAGSATGDAVSARIKAAVPPDAPTEVATAGELRRYSLRIFDRSFAVTRWLQGVALAIGLAGIAASFSAQVLARRREFGTLQHLGFTRRQVLTLVASEGALWSAVGAVLGLALGLAVSVVLVKVVNPQSFHWTMQMTVPPGSLLVLGLGVVLAGAFTAWGSGHAAASRDVVRAVKEDW